MAKSMSEVLRESKEKVLTNTSGTPLVTYEEQRDLGQRGHRDKWDENRLGTDLGLRKMNPDGTIAKSWYTTAAINEDRFYDNRYRVKDGVLELVTAQTADGYRAITEQSSGRVFSKVIPAVTLERKGSDLVFGKSIVVSDTDFIAEFTHKLDKETMKGILPLIPSGGTTIPEGKLPI